MRLSSLVYYALATPFCVIVSGSFEIIVLFKKLKSQDHHGVPVDTFTLRREWPIPFEEIVFDLFP
jgi:hypothetical protein